MLPPLISSPLFAFIAPSQWIVDAPAWQWALVFGLPILAAWWMYGRGSGTAKTATGGGMAIGGRIA
ncbi:hypothetical protein N8134_04615, partial [Flavobacteriales bacterium]|nr:hypothetical protein [Flavobacteriales bacterium]